MATSPRPSRSPDTSASVARQLTGKAHFEKSTSPLLEAKMLFKLVELKRESPDAIRLLIGNDNDYRKQVLRCFECLLDPSKRVMVPPVVKKPEPEPEPASEVALAPSVALCEPVVPKRKRRTPEPEPPAWLGRLLNAEEVASATAMLRAGSSFVAVRQHFGCGKSTLYRSVKYRKGKRRK